MQPRITISHPFSPPGNQPLTYEAASSAAAATAIRPCAVPASSALQSRLRDPYFHDSYRLPMDDPQCPALGLLLRAASQSPQWVERLMGLRNRIVAVVAKGEKLKKYGRSRT